MKIRGLLLASSAVAALAVGQAQAGIYISVLGGPNWIPDETIRTTNGSTGYFEFDTGYVVGGAVGGHLDSWVQGLRAEVEVAYRHNKIDGPFSGNGTSTGMIDGSLSNFSVMANVWYDIDLGSKLKPHIGGGIGWARAHDKQHWTTVGDPNYFTTANHYSGFAFQLGVGITYEIAAGLGLGVDYRFFDGPTIPLYDGDFGPGDRIDNTSHSVAVSLTADVF